MSASIIPSLKSILDIVFKRESLFLLGNGVNEKEEILHLNPLVILIQRNMLQHIL